MIKDSAGKTLITVKPGQSLHFDCNPLANSLFLCYYYTDGKPPGM